MSIKEIFLNLTAKTTLSGYEQDIFKIIETIISTTLSYDSFGNGYLKIGQSDTIFMSHVDNFTESSKDVCHIFDGDFIKTDQTTILGADDKAGVSIMLHMINHQIPGLYCFFKAEEHGCLGSKAFKIEHFKMLHAFKKCVSFDRKGYSDIVICQNNINTASAMFALDLINKLNLNYKIIEHGGSTDSSVFKYIIPECINISVGYFQQHSFRESVNITFLSKLADRCLNVDWQGLNIYREIPSLNQALLFEITAQKMKERKEILLIEAELGFSLY
jgi:di/tripeptidase